MSKNSNGARKIRVAINGFGRIGRAFLKIATERPELEIVAINDLGDLENLAYLLKYDSVYHNHDFAPIAKEGKLCINDQEVPFLSEREPENLPWKNMDVDVVIESTGFFATYELSQKHLKAGAKKVVISAPAKDEAPEGIDAATVLMGVNPERLQTCQISSNGSCTTNAASPLIAILDEKLGIEKAMLNTVHGYTATQSLVDGPNKKDYRKGRAAAVNMIPTSTGAAIAVTKALPQLENKFDGISVRVPVVSGSIADVTFIAKRDTTVEEINKILKDAEGDLRWKGIFKTTEEQLVSTDILEEPFAAIADLGMTRVVDGNLVKVMSWYDNEMGYTNTLVEHVIKTGQALTS